MSPVQKLSCGFLRLPVASVFTVDIFVLCATHDPQINTSYQQNPGSKHPSGGKMSTGLLASAAVGAYPHSCQVPTVGPCPP